MRTATFVTGDSDKAMEKFYDLIASRQNVHARLQTLVNIVAGVAKSKATSPVFRKISETDSCGMVHGRWKADADRDNRGKVYLYFSPEDMTVALDNMRGIGWQGIPDAVSYLIAPPPSNKIDVLSDEAKFGPSPSMLKVERMALKEMGPSFRQRVFTGKLRAAAGLAKPAPVLIGQPPHDFVLRLPGEDDHAHVASSGRMLRQSLPQAGQFSLDYPVYRFGIRTINGEALKTPCEADIWGNQVSPDKIPTHSMLAHLKRENRGPCEEVDPIDAATAVASNKGLLVKTVGLPASVVASVERGGADDVSEQDRQRLEVAYNNSQFPGNTNPDDMSRILWATRYKHVISAQVQESPNAARLRWQQEVSPKSFHSAIFGSSKNHQRVTAYDLSIGSGKAVSDPAFYAYLCAVADWRLKKTINIKKARKGILTWSEFLFSFSAFYANEPDWRRQLIVGNADYYSSGALPHRLPLLGGGLWDIVISETISGKRVMSASKGKS